VTDDAAGGPYRQVWIYLEESDRWHGKSVWILMLERLRQLGCTGATVLRGVAGYGSHGLVHTAHLVELSSNLPIVVTFIEQAPRVAELLTSLSQEFEDACRLAVVHDVNVYRPQSKSP
jgi:PII-like signaling protein